MSLTLEPPKRVMYSRHYRARHREKTRAAARARAKQWRLDHPEEARAKDKRQREKYAVKRRLARQAHYQAHQAEAIAYAVQYRITNKEPMRTRRLAAYQQDPAKFLSVCYARRARIHGAAVNDLTAAQWREMQTAQDHRCYYCQKRCKGRLTQDHLTPLSKGGSHTLHNVIGACRACNTRKGTRPPPVPVQPLLLTVAPAKKT